MPPAGKRGSMLVVSDPLMVLLPVSFTADEPVFVDPPDNIVVLAAANDCEEPVVLKVLNEASFEPEAEGAKESKTREVSAEERLADTETESEDQLISTLSLSII